MYLDRPDGDTIDRYTGPYERWVFSNELGRPFAFPAVADQNNAYNTALLEGAHIPPNAPGFVTRLPPIWNPTGQTRSVTPFAFYDDTANETVEKYAPTEDTKVSTMLHALRDGTYRTRSAVNPRFRVNFPIDPKTWTPTYNVGEAPDNWVEPGTKPAAIIAVIDDGLPFAHEAFLDRHEKTRVSHCWLQSGAAQDEACVPFGRELVNADIDDLRDNFGNDEAQLYRRAGAVDTGVPELGTNLRRHATHGSHVMGVAAGNGPIFDAAPLDDTVQIITVQLPNTIAWDTSGFGKEMYMLSALHYVFERASRIAANYGDTEIPLVVNFSYGWSASRHDGESEMELAIQELLEARVEIQPLTALCMPSGNNYGSQMHGVIADRDFSGDPATAKIGWQIQPDDLTSSYLELWFPRDFDPAGYSISLTPPQGTTMPQVSWLDVSADPAVGDGDGDPRRYVEVEHKGQNIGQLSADQHRGTRWRVMAALIPSVYTRGESRVAPPGLWTLTVHRDPSAAILTEEGELQIWLQRDDDPSDLKSLGRQSRLVSFSPSTSKRHTLQAYGTELDQVRGFGALNGVASSPATTRVSGYVQQTGNACSYSGAGGLRQNDAGDISLWGEHPGLTAVADQSAMRPGIPSIGVTTGARARLVGTSGACPTAARIMVRNAAAGLPLKDGLAVAGPLVAQAGVPQQIAIQDYSRLGTTIAPPVLKNG
jgi:hypothetical protein